MRARVAAVLIACLALGLGAAPALASPDDPDTEVAKRYFDQGTEAYLQGDYATAIDRFGAARRVKPLPAFDYNLGRCYDRSDQPEQAIEAYRRFLAASPSGDGADEARARLSVLETRVAATASTAPTPTANLPPARVDAPRHGGRFRGAWISLGVTAALGVAALSSGVYTVVEHGSLQSGCGATRAGCSDGQLSAMRHAAIATDVLIGVTSAAAIATIVLFVVESRHRVAAPARARLERGAVVF